MTSMEMAIAELKEQPMEQEVAGRRKTTWPLPVIAAIALHGAAVALVLASSLLPRQTPMLTGEIIPVTLYAAAPAATTASITTPSPAPPTPAIQPPKPAPKPVPRTVTRSIKPISKTPPQAVSVSPKPAAKAAPPAPPEVTTAPQMAQGSENAEQSSGTAVKAGPSGEKGGTANTVVPARPRYRDNPPPAYPELARRRQIEGTVVLEALVNGRGRVDDLNVHASSGYNLLDDAALRAVRNWLFDPGKKGGMPMAMTVLVPVRFALR